jgi:hypothetical protein
MYLLAQDSDLTQFLTDVSNAIEDGYKCQGGIFVRNKNVECSQWVYYQALVKDTDAQLENGESMFKGAA